jgi:hypothetical protein
MEITKIEKHWSSKRKAVQEVTAFQSLNFKSTAAQAVAPWIFGIRHPRFVILPVIPP